MPIHSNPTEVPAMPVLTPGTSVSYLGHPATVIYGNEPAPEWGQNKPRAVVNVRFDREVRGHSRQFDMYATSLLPL